jgi:hypothetical protein
MHARRRPRQTRGALARCVCAARAACAPYTSPPRPPSSHPPQSLGKGSRMLNYINARMRVTIQDS